MRCPICRVSHPEGTMKCNICGLENIAPDFLNMDDAKAWKDEIETRRNMWLYDVSGELAKYLPDYKLSPEERTVVQLDSMFNYTELNRKLKENPNDFIARSTLIDHLHQAYIYGHTFRVSSRNYLRSKLLSHIEFFEYLPQKSDRHIQFINCSHLIFMAEIYLSECNFKEVIRYYCKYIIELQHIDKYFYSCEDDEHSFLHNIIEICKLLAIDNTIIIELTGLSNAYYKEYCEQHGLEKTLEYKKIHEKVDSGKLFMHDFDYCGMPEPDFYTDKLTNEICQTHRDLYVCTFNQCVIDIHGMSRFREFSYSVGTGYLDVIAKNNLIYEIQYVTEFSQSEAIYLHRDAIQAILLPFIKELKSERQKRGDCVSYLTD